MYRITILLFAALQLLSCNVKEKETPKGKYFYDFDEIVHYQVSYNQPHELMAKRDNLSVKDSLSFKFIWGLDENKLDTEIESKLNHTTYIKNNIDSLKHYKLREIFKETDIKLDWGTLCAPAFRDILVFKKKKHVIGVAKLCLECSKSQFIGTTNKVSNFGSNGEFEKLNKILNEAQKMN